MSNIKLNINNQLFLKFIVKHMTAPDQEVRTLKIESTPF